MEYWQVMMAIAIGGVMIGLPFVFVESLRVPAKKWAVGVGLALAGSACFSTIVAAGGNCGFLDTFLMLGKGCNNLPYANTRTVPVLNTLAFICLLLLLLSVVRAAVSVAFFRKS